LDGWIIGPGKTLPRGLLDLWIVDLQTGKIPAAHSSIDPKIHQSTNPFIHSSTNLCIQQSLPDELAPQTSVGHRIAHG
jgi:hypothetical protein